jgi:hypothetical protein
MFCHGSNNFLCKKLQYECNDFTDVIICAIDEAHLKILSVVPLGCARVVSAVNDSIARLNDAIVRLNDLLVCGQ